MVATWFNYSVCEDQMQNRLHRTLSKEFNYLVVLGKMFLIIRVIKSFNMMILNWNCSKDYKLVHKHVFKRVYTKTHKLGDIGMYWENSTAPHKTMNIIRDRLLAEITWGLCGFGHMVAIITRINTQALMCS